MIVVVAEEDESREQCNVTVIVTLTNLTFWVNSSPQLCSAFGNRPQPQLTRWYLIDIFLTAHPIPAD
jgi:hypothetical protein